MAKSLTTIAFDADDTLWHNERFFKLTQDRFAELLADFADADHLDERLLAAERKNIGHYGFGIKGFTLSMIETALEITDGKVGSHVIQEILDTGRDMLRHPIELLDHVQSTILELTPNFHLLLITKGDLLDQERKLAQSGLGDYFDGVEIVSNKTPEIYRDAFAKAGAQADQSMMVGNSMKSDVLPAIAAGGWGVYVPHGEIWALEAAPKPKNHPMYREINNLSNLPQLIDDLF
ncbi:putative hydrolase, haloacid dehalogenase-like family protein [Rhodobacteraceae bacterium HTCC2150]|nr:putative hydrolase, haloacid dehalogenase-like family protein [Rhodobacteraceae bacterium HTCC2150]